MPLIELGLIDGNYFADEHVDAIEAAINNVDTRVVAADALAVAHTAALAALPAAYAPLIPARRVSVGKTAAQNIGVSTDTVITWPDEDYDTDTIHSTSVNTGRLTIPAGMGGLWNVGYWLSVQAPAPAPHTRAWVRVNGAGVKYCQDLTKDGDPALLSSTEQIVLAAGDYIEVIANENSTVAAQVGWNGAGLPASRFKASWVGP